MTHFTVGLIVPDHEQSNLRAFITEQMAPYDENLPVAPYVCYSIEQARIELDHEIRRFTRIIERQEPSFSPEKCREHLEKLRQTTPAERYREYVQFHGAFNHRGEPMSTRNPAGKWDWYRIGGRWDGWITGNEISSDNGFNFSARHEDIANNVASTGQALERDVIPHAIITPNGHWHERGQLGWWGILLTDNDGWESKARSILGEFPDHHVVILDAHL